METSIESLTSAKASFYLNFVELFKAYVVPKEQRKKEPICDK